MNIGITAAIRARTPAPVKLGAREIRALFAWLRRRAALIGYLLAALITFVGWAGRAERNISAGDGLGYALGIVGASLMAALLLYPMRKRIPVLHFLGSTRLWFIWHMVLGIVGPILVLYHSNFQLGSLNSRIALYCMLAVAGSGLVGHYLYSKIHSGLYGRRLTLQSLTEKMQKSLDQISTSGGLVKEIQEHLTQLDRQVIEPPRTVLESLTRPLSMAIRTRIAYVRLNWVLRKKLIVRSFESPVITEHRSRLESLTKRYLRTHLREVRSIANLSLFERLFSFWHLFHLPFFLMLIISAIVHILAVHMY